MDNPLVKYGRWIILTLAVCTLVAGLLAVKSCRDAQTAKVGTKLATGQRDAATDSGHDAVQTTGNVAANESETHATVKDGTDAIHNATAGDSNDAADRATCRLKAYRKTPKCIKLIGNE